LAPAKEVVKVTVFIALKIIRGAVTNGKVFLRRESAEQAEKRWLKEQGIRDNTSREVKAQEGMVFLVMECELKP